MQTTTQPAPHYNTESGDHLSGSRISHRPDPPLDFGRPWRS